METFIELSIKPFENLLLGYLFCFAGIFRPLQTTSNHFRPLQTTSDHFRPLQTTSINHFKPLQVPNAASTNHFKPLQPTSNEMLGVIKGSIIIYIRRPPLLAGQDMSENAEPRSPTRTSANSRSVQEDSPDKRLALSSTAPANSSSAPSRPALSSTAPVGGCSAPKGGNLSFFFMLFNFLAKFTKHGQKKIKKSFSKNKNL